MGFEEGIKQCFPEDTTGSNIVTQICSGYQIVDKDQEEGIQTEVTVFAEILNLGRRRNIVYV